LVSHGCNTHPHMTTKRASKPLSITGESLTTLNIVQTAREGQSVQLAPSALNNLKRANTLLGTVLSDGEAHYGINTGFGSFSRQRIPHADLMDLQRNLVRSHAAGVGGLLNEDVVRGMMLCLVASLSRGCSGVRPMVVETLVKMLNAGITPIVPETG